MARVCTSCSTNWKSIVFFCPKCGIDLRSKVDNEVKTAPIKLESKDKESRVFTSSVVWIVVGIFLFGALFASVELVGGGSIGSPAQENPAITENQSDSSVIAQDETDQTNAETLTGNPESPDNPTSFIDQETKVTLTLDAWVQKHSADEAFNSIQKWSATFRLMNPTQIDETQNKLGDARGFLDAAWFNLTTNGSPRVPIFDQKQKEVINEVENYLDTTTDLYVQVNNEYHNSRQDVVNLLEEKITSLSKVNIKINSLLDWLKINGSSYETR
jgi:hypothetical protein